MDRSVGGRLACALVAALALLLVSFGGSVAFAKTAPTVVRELPEQATMNSTTYELSDGSYRTEIAEEPYQFKGADGKWRPIDTTLIPGSEAGVFIPKGTPMGIAFANQSELLLPLRIDYEGARLSFDLLAGC